jgi:hypothetical protein
MPGKQPPPWLLPSPRQHCRRWRRCRRTSESDSFNCDMSNAAIFSIPSLVTHNQGDLAFRGSGSNEVADKTRHLQTRCPSVRSGWASIAICKAVKAGEETGGANQQVSDTSTPSRVCQCVHAGRNHYSQGWMKQAQDGRTHHHAGAQSILIWTLVYLALPLFKTFSTLSVMSCFGLM